MIARLVLLTRSLTLIPHVLTLLASPHRQLIEADIDRWSEVLSGAASTSRVPRLQRFVRLMHGWREFRNLFYFRLGPSARLLRPLCPGLESLLLCVDELGPGLFIQHGIATIVTARRIGANCWINQQVTVGYTDAGGPPSLGNDVMIGAGAKVLGPIHIGDGARIGANAVVLRDVPAHCTAVGVPARIVQRASPEPQGRASGSPMNTPSPGDDTLFQ